MLNVLIGGLITLVATLLVQVIVIPRVQRQTRKRERWERDVTELQTLMENEFPRHIRALRRAIVPYLAFHALPEPPRAEALTQPPYQAAAAEAIAAHDELIDAAMRMMWLVRRAAVYRPGNDPYWSKLLTDIGKLHSSVTELDPRGFTKNAETSGAEYDRLLGNAHNQNGLIYATLTYTIDPLEPPKTRSLEKQRRWLSDQRRRVIGRVSRRKPVTASPPDASQPPG